MYNLNWNAFVQDKTPSAVRKPKLLALLGALLYPLKTLHTDFLLWKTAQERHVAISPQVRIMRYWLNELFDTSARRFVIRDYINVTPVLIWGESYNRPLYLPTFLSSKAYDFEVIAHCDTYPQRHQIKAFLEAYKLAGKKYKLEFRDSIGHACVGVGIPDLEDF
jgi:hypothetical protein